MMTLASALINFILLFTCLFASNYLESIGKLEIGGIITGFAIPIVGVILPARIIKNNKFKLHFYNHFSIHSIVIYIIFTMLFVFCLIRIQNINWSMFPTHFVCSAFFHFTYYVLYAGLLQKSINRSIKSPYSVIAIVFTSILFTLFHYSQYNTFPEGISLCTQLKILAIFCINLYMYKIFKSLLLSGLFHSITGALDLASNGRYIIVKDFGFAIILVTLLGYCWYGFTHNQFSMKKIKN